MQKAGYLSKTSQIIFDLHPGFFHMEDEKGNKLHLFKKYFKMMFFIAPAYSKVRYRSPNFRLSVRSFVRSFVRPSVNIYVEV